MYTNDLFPGVVSIVPYPSEYTYPSLGPVVPLVLTNMKRSPPRINTILPISVGVSKSPNPAKAPPTNVIVNILPSKNSDNVLKNPATTKPTPGEPVMPVAPYGPVTPVIPLPVGPVPPIYPSLPGSPLGPSTPVLP
jgi:hypothetical protein